MSRVTPSTWWNDTMLNRDLSQPSLAGQKTHEKGDRATSGKLKPVFAGMPIVSK
jgi:hypothetical protein